MNRISILSQLSVLPSMGLSIHFIFRNEHDKNGSVYKKNIVLNYKIVSELMHTLSVQITIYLTSQNLNYSANNY